MIVPPRSESASRKSPPAPARGRPSTTSSEGPRGGRRYSAPIDASIADRHRFKDAGEISDGGERVSHLVKDPVYYGHLSIYDFATRFCRDAVVLDAGCGAGYGAARLADAGARRGYGIDVSAKAIAFSRHHFRRPNLEFAVADLGQLSSPSNPFD